MGQTGPADELAKVLDVLSARGLVATRVSVAGLEVSFGAIELPKEAPKDLTPEEQRKLYEATMYASAGGDS